MEENKLIAEFMGVGKHYEAKSSNMFNQYHADWNRLIPVLEKIESLSIVSFEKNLQEEGDYQCLFTKGSDILICHYADTSIEATYKAVVEFIKTNQN